MTVNYPFGNSFVTMFKGSTENEEIFMKNLTFCTVFSRILETIEINGNLGTESVTPGNQRLNINLNVLLLKDNSFSTFAKFSKKLTFFTR